MQDLTQTVFYGTIGKNAAESLTKLVGNFFMPEIRGNKTWPASLTKDLVGSVERFMGNMTDMANLAAGKTALYVPQDDLRDVRPRPCCMRALPPGCGCVGRACGEAMPHPARVLQSQGLHKLYARVSALR
jgi:hypothetical protein